MQQLLNYQKECFDNTMESFNNFGLQVKTYSSLLAYTKAVYCVDLLRNAAYNRITVSTK